MFAKEEWTLRFAQAAMEQFLNVETELHILYLQRNQVFETTSINEVAKYSFDLAEAMIKEAQKRGAL